MLAVTNCQGCMGVAMRRLRMPFSRYWAKTKATEKTDICMMRPGDDAGSSEFDEAEVVGGDGFFVDGEKGRDVVDEEGGFVGELVNDGECGGGVLRAAFVGVDGEPGGGR